jgi:ABC-type spermidine/putrescine transport system permease subunit I
MKNQTTTLVIKILAWMLAVFLLIQGTDLSYYLMNQPDTYLFNLGVVLMVGVYVGIFYSILQIGKTLSQISKQINSEKN